MTNETKDPGLEAAEQALKELTLAGPFDRELGSLRDVIGTLRPEDIELHPDGIADLDQHGRLTVHPVRLSQRLVDTLQTRGAKLFEIAMDTGRPMFERQAADRERSKIFEACGYVGEVTGSSQVDHNGRYIDPGQERDGSRAGQGGPVENQTGVFYRSDDPRGRRTGSGQDW